MSSIPKNTIDDVEQLIIHGEFKEALKIIEQNLQNNVLKKVDELNYLVLKSEILNYLGKHTEALKLADRVHKEGKKLENILLQADALIQKAIIAYSFEGQFTKALRFTEEGLKLLADDSLNIQEKQLAKRKALLLLWCADLTSQMGDFDKGFELFSEGFRYADISENKQLIARYNVYQGAFYNFKSEFEKAELCLEKALEIIETINNKLDLAIYYMVLGQHNKSTRNYEKALEAFHKALSLLDSTGSKLNYSGIYNDMGGVYLRLYQLDKALECYEFALKNMTWGHHIMLSNIGWTYLNKYELEKAREYYLKAWEESNKVSDKRILPEILYGLLQITLELKDFTKAQEYLEQLKQLSNETGFKHIERRYRFANIMFLKTRGEISDLVEATKLLKELLAETKSTDESRLDLLYLLLEIQIKELQISTSKTAMEEVKKQLTRLEVVAEEQQLQWFLANIYQLQSQLALIELDAQKAIKLLGKAQAIANEIEVELLKKTIKEDQEKIEKQLSMWNKLQEQNAPIKEVIKHVSLENSIRNIKRETVLEERDEETGKVIEYRKLFAIKL